MKNWIPNSKIVRLSALALALSAAAYLIGLFLVLGSIGKIGSLYDNTDSESSKENRVHAIKSILEANKSEIATLRAYFIKKDDEVGFIKEIERAGKEVSLKFEIDSIDVDQDPNSAFKEDVSIKMNIEGSWGSIVGFLSRLEKMPFGVSVEDLNLDSHTPGAWSGTLELVVYKEK